jgi:hypothetical protein
LLKQGGFGLGLHFPGFPDDSDWTTALGTFAVEQPVWFGAILAFIAIAEGESVGHSGDNFRGKSTKKDQGDLNFDYLGLKKKLSPAQYDRYKDVEMKVSEFQNADLKRARVGRKRLAYDIIQFSIRMVAPP